MMTAGIRKERTLIIFKPDALQRKLMGEILNRFERLGLDLLLMKTVFFTEDLCREHYKHLVDKKFFPEIVAYMTSGPTVAAILSGENAVAAVRHILGATNPLEAAPGTIRGDYALTSGANLVHASGSPEEANEEIVRFFKEEELRKIEG